MTTFNTTIYTYCPDYDIFYSDSQEILEKRLVTHSRLKEPEIRNAVRNTIAEIKRLGHGTFRGEYVANYSASFINHPEIKRLIRSWTGPIISDQYKEKFHDSCDETCEMDANKFNKDAINWLDQASYKVTGKYFFAEHLKAIKQYLQSFCRTLDISKQKRQMVLSYGCIYCVNQLLSIRMRFRRSREQPLIRNTTLRDSKELHCAFKTLYAALDLAKLKQTVKYNNKRDPNKKGGNRYRVDSNKFAKNLRVYATNLLRKEQKALGVPTDDEDEDDMNRLLPDYFKDLQVANAAIVDVDMSDGNNRNKNKKRKKKRRVVVPPKPTPPPKPVTRASKHRRSKPKTVRKCRCETHDEYPTTNRVFVPVPVPVPVPYGHPDPMSFIDRHYPFLSMGYPPARGGEDERRRFEPFGYQPTRGGGYRGPRAPFRAHPYAYAMPPQRRMAADHAMPLFAPARQHETFANESMMPQVPSNSPFPDWHTLPRPNPMMERNWDPLNMDNRSTGDDTPSLSFTPTNHTITPPPPNHNIAAPPSMDNITPPPPPPHPNPSDHMPLIGDPNISNPMDCSPMWIMHEYESESDPNIL